MSEEKQATASPFDLLRNTCRGFSHSPTLARNRSVILSVLGEELTGLGGGGRVYLSSLPPEHQQPLSVQRGQLTM